ncbi:hypothetical protein D5282_01580 [bacterium 1xD8-48]|nr:hypothetical protein [Lachnospiraceae bacterium]NBJ96037.1 hypothetical protein [bacterium 1xD8-48]
MEKYLNITLKPQKVEFTGKSIKITDTISGKFQIPYRELASAYIRICDRETGGYYEPELADITGNMDGELILYNFQKCRWKIYTDETGKTAGSMLSELVKRAPYILSGGNSWIDLENEEDFSEIEKMVKLMRQCR